MDSIKNFSIMEVKETGAKSIMVYYFSGVIREYFCTNGAKLPSSVLEAISSGSFRIAKTRESEKMYGQWYERI